MSSLPACSETTDGNGNNAFACRLSPGQAVGLMFVAEASAISLFSCILLLLLIIRNVLRYRRFYKGESGRWSLFRGPADIYVSSLILADMIQSVGGFLDVKWVYDNVTQGGSYCTVQGALKQLGETSVALNTVIISVHTFLVVFLRKGTYHPRAIALGVVVLVWSIVIILVVVENATNSNFYDPSPYWCWIGAAYNRERLYGEYLWLWVALLIAVLVYVPLFLWSWGWIDVDVIKWWPFHRSGSFNWEGKPHKVRGRPDAPSLALLAYPVAYSFIILPISIVRWKTFTSPGQQSVPDWATFFAASLHDMFGATNVALLLYTRPNLLLFVRPEEVGEHGMTGSRKSAGVDSLAKEEDGSIDEPRYEMQAMQAIQSHSSLQSQTDHVLRRSEESSCLSVGRLGVRRHR